MITPKTRPYASSTIQRALDILNLFKNQQFLSFADMQRILGYKKSTLFRVLAVLQTNNYLSRDEGGRYRLGLNIFILGQAISKEFMLKTVAEPHMKALARSVELTVHMGILDRLDVVIIEKAEPEKHPRMISRIGSSVPAHCTGQGKTLLAYSPREIVEEIIREKGLKQYTPNTIIVAEELLQELEDIHRKSYALDNSEHERHIRCVAVPLLDEEGQMQAALSITGTILDLPDEAAIRKALYLLEATRDRIRGELGYCIPARSDSPSGH